MRRETLFNARGFILCGAFLLAKPTTSQMPAPLGKLYITSTTPGASIMIGTQLRPEVTPVTLAVMPNTYSVKIGSCGPQTVTVKPSQTVAVNCAR
jgi:hypothetical protein